MARPKNKILGDRGFSDPTGEYPKIEHIDQSSLNKAVRGHKVNEVYVSGGDKGLGLGLQPLIGSKYTKNSVRETEGGHVFEMDDTPGTQRIVILHSSKAGIEIRSDGTVIISSGEEGNKVEIVGNDHKMIVERNGDVHYKGNLNFKVDGDMNLEVGGNLKTKVHGNEISTIDGNFKQTVEKSHTTEIKKNRAQYVLGVNTDISLDNKETHIKGNETKFVEGTVDYNTGDTLTLTSEGSIVMSANTTNIAGNTVSLVGKQGTIGGESVTHYGRNYFGTSATFTAGVTAPTFHGALQGNALTATEAGKAGTAGAIGASGSAGSIVNTATDTTQTVEPTVAIMNDYLLNSSLGIRKVNIDADKIINNAINVEADFGDITTRRLDSAEARSKLRDNNNYNNSKFIGALRNDGILSANASLGLPTEIGRIVTKKQKSFGENPIGQTSNPLIKPFKEL
jgi:hypothetical protein|tara:strand:+ start:350 stop:1705 length:1356 start_codon:yes stop_codon:yes gene_type:complete